MRIYLVRHGETELNQKKCYYGHMDVGLSEKGVKQAKAIGAFFQNRSFDVVVSSPLIRAVKTGKTKDMKEIRASMEALCVRPTLERLLYPEGEVPDEA